MFVGVCVYFCVYVLEGMCEFVFLLILSSATVTTLDENSLAYDSSNPPVRTMIMLTSV